ncbi:phosphonate C-P lyase system protein PhnG [Cohnella abietis]|uniref:Phosphonate C-P lyase system protein PhnG n=1 Tax=Cohnella abietis TaxID=2507935 RepID=A0A3T1DCV5_9BACL|nr:phosphonate C-P lyase system protein PhnG [Cohnella abietis]BBI35932.1 phosphonate C-P lyase system protein PhnG [Cohnella abietis]
MNAKERTQTLTALPSEELVEWKGKIESLGISEAIHSPALGLVMMRASESVTGQAFNVGEILISDSTVMLDGTLGYGVTMGNDADKAYTLALIDAIYHSDDAKWDSLKIQLQDWLHVQQGIQLEARKQSFQQIQRTLVDFEVMDTEQEE